MKVEWYRPDAVAVPGPAVILLPILGGNYPVERIIAHHLASVGFSAVIACRTRSFRSFRQVDGLNDLIGAVLEEQMRVVDWMALRPEIDGSRLGCVGISMGAIQGCLLSAADARIRATVLALGGGDLPYILARSKDFGLAQRRRAVLESTGWTVPEFEERLRSEVQWDPMLVANHIDARTTLLILARFDATIPLATGLRLRAEIGGPETVTLPAGHYSSAIFLPSVLSDMTRFLRRHVADGQPTPTRPCGRISAAGHAVERSARRAEARNSPVSCRSSECWMRESFARR